MTTSVGGVVNYRVRVELRGVRVEVHHTVVVLKQVSHESCYSAIMLVIIQKT